MQIINQSKHTHERNRHTMLETDRDSECESKREGERDTDICADSVELQVNYINHL